MLNNTTKETNFYQLVSEIYRCNKIDELRTAVINGVGRLTPYNSAAFFMVNPESRQFKEPLLVRMDHSWFKKYEDYYEEKDIYKKTVFAGAGIPPVDRSSDYINYREWEKNEHRADFLLAQGIYNIACLQVLDGNKLVGEISLHRDIKQPDFNNEEMKILMLLQQHICNAFSKLVIIRQRDILLELLKDMNDRKDGKGYLLLSKNYQIIKYNRAAALILGGDKGIEHKLNQLCRQLSFEYRSGSLCPWTDRKGYIHSESMVLYHASVTFDGNGEMFFLINIEKMSGSGQSAANVSGSRITAREREIANLISMGKSNAEICGQLFISENTLKTHLRKLYDKLGVKNRNELAFTVYQGIF